MNNGANVQPAGINCQSNFDIDSQTLRRQDFGSAGAVCSIEESSVPQNLQVP